MPQSLRPCSRGGVQLVSYAGQTLFLQCALAMGPRAKQGEEALGLLTAGCRIHPFANSTLATADRLGARAQGRIWTEITDS